MKAIVSALCLILIAHSATGGAQITKPSISIGTHVLTLGMPETVVLKQLGNDLELRPLNLRTLQGSDGWGVSKKVGEVYQFMGSVYFDASHHLSSAMRNWSVQGGSSKSLFYAIDAAVKSAENDGFTTCHISTSDDEQTVDNGSYHTKHVRLDCGVKQISMMMTLSDTPDIASTIEVSESLNGK